MYNGLARELKAVVRIPVDETSYTLLDPNGNEVQLQVSLMVLR